ncbi:hypothetical protein HELRODRAFT_162522 [Helobdella robusta]|uniref:Uncharacterized protein n=1 Tax=Helobdella robusta TaxID=6412 RepID=T1ESS6_HELRO|nr:hypothetical protein HELRODRAFT_162522 [Helobdella robusta]ESN99044.1 hypothetical protein HELRODRAFT_162522 [Helobdella robusta]
MSGELQRFPRNSPTTHQHASYHTLLPSNHGTTRRMPLLPDPPTTNPIIQLHHPGTHFKYRPLQPIIPGNNHNKNNNTKNNVKRNPNNNNNNNKNNNTKTAQHHHHRMDNNKFQQIRTTARLIYKKTQITHHINNWKEDKVKVLKTTINNLKDNINPPKKNDTFNQAITEILDNTYKTIKNTIIDHLNNELSIHNTINYENIDLIDDTKPIEDHIRFLQRNKNFHNHKENVDDIVKNEIKRIKAIISNNNSNNNTKYNTNNKDSIITSTPINNHDDNYDDISNTINNNIEHNNNNNCNDNNNNNNDNNNNESDNHNNNNTNNNNSTTESDNSISNEVTNNQDANNNNQNNNNENILQTGNKNNNNKFIIVRPYNRQLNSFYEEIITTLILHGCIQNHNDILQAYTINKPLRRILFRH